MHRPRQFWLLFWHERSYRNQLISTAYSKVKRSRQVISRNSTRRTCFFFWPEYGCAQGPSFTRCNSTELICNQPCHFSQFRLSFFVGLPDFIGNSLIISLVNACFSLSSFGVRSFIYSSTNFAPTRPFGKPKTSTNSKCAPVLTRTVSPTFNSRLALTAAPSTSTFPSFTRVVDTERVLNNRTDHRNLSTRTLQSSTIKPMAGMADPALV